MKPIIFVFICVVLCIAIVHSAPSKGQLVKFTDVENEGFENDIPDEDQSFTPKFGTIGAIGIGIMPFGSKTNDNIFLNFLYTKANISKYLKKF